MLETKHTAFLRLCVLFGGQSMGLVLAVRTVECAALADDGLFDAAAALQAGLALAAVDFVFLLEVAAFAFAVDEVAQGAAAFFDGAAQGFADVVYQCRRFFAADLHGGAVWGDAGGEQAFVGVDVAYADDGFVVHQYAFYRAAAFFQGVVEVVGGKAVAQRFGCEVLQQGVGFFRAGIP